MRRLLGQVIRHPVTRHSGRVAHHVLQFVFLVVLVVFLAAGAAAWRLSQGPVNMDWAARELENQLNGDGGPTRLSIGSAALAWEGFAGGVDRPLDLRVGNVTVQDTSGRTLVEVPRAELSLSLYELLLGRIVPRALEIDEPRIRLLRAEDGAVTLDLGSLGEATEEADAPATGDDAAGSNGQAEPPMSIARLFRELGRPPQSDLVRARRNRYSQLRLLRVRDAVITVVDRQLGAEWQIPRAEIDLRRREAGGVQGEADISLALGDEHAQLTLRASLDRDGTHVRAKLSPITPGALARAAPKLAPLAALEASVSTEADLDLTPTLAVRRARVDVQSGPGSAHLGKGTVALRAAHLQADIGADAIKVETLRIEFPGPTGVPAPVLQAHGDVQRAAGRLAASVVLDINQIGFAQLPQLWPEGTGGGSRSWIVQNITAGTAKNGHVELGLEAPEDLSDVVLTRATGALEGQDITLWWLRPIPPVEHSQASLRIVDPDTIDITAQGGTQAGGSLTLSDGHMRITGLAGHRQMAAITLQLGGPIPDAIAVLTQPRLHLFATHPLDLRDPSGTASVKLSVNLPLEDKVSMDDIAIHAQGQLSDAHLSGVVAGKDLDQGAFDLDVTAAGLKMNGHALLSRIPIDLGVEMDFRSGPPNQVLQKITATGRPEAKLLAAAGFDPIGALGGTPSLSVVLTERRNGQGEVAANADLKDAELNIAALGYHKAAGTAGSAAAKVRMLKDRIVSVESIALTADRLAVRGHADFAGGAARNLKLEQVQIGETNGRGEVTFPPPDSRTEPVRISMSGSVIDVSPRLARKREINPEKKPPEPGSPWVVDGHFDRAILGYGRQLTDAALHAENDGRVTRRAKLTGRTGPSGAFELAIVPEGGGRRLTGSAADAGALLRALDIVPDMEGGTLTVQAVYDDSVAEHPMSGTAEIAHFRMRNAPAIARLLQGMTLYGLVELVQGPGLAFDKLEAPFRMTDDVLELKDARVFSSALGLTAKGRIDLVASTMDMQGTIVPAYFFNSLLGNVPILGKLFSPEKGGGVFAANYSITGSFTDPQVSVNPLSALTPGFLRGIFGIF